MSALDTHPSDVLGKEDDDAIREIADILVRTVRRDYPPGTLARRDAHPKHHGCVRAEFRIDADVPAKLRHGVFAEPRTFPAWIRFSNGAPKAQSDHRRDQRGMAIKLLDVPGPKVLEDERTRRRRIWCSQAPHDLIRSISDYVRFVTAAEKKPAFRVLGFFFGWNPLSWKLHDFRALLSTLEHAANPLGIRYWSQTPYRLGPHTVNLLCAPAPSGRAGVVVALP